MAHPVTQAHTQVVRRTWEGVLVELAGVEAAQMSAEAAAAVLCGHQARLDPLQLRVEQERAEPRADRVVRHQTQVVRVELERQRELVLDLTTDRRSLGSLSRLRTYKCGGLGYMLAINTVPASY